LYLFCFFGLFGIAIGGVAALRRFGLDGFFVGSDDECNE